MTTFLSLAVIVSQSVVGWHGHDGPLARVCDVCGLEKSAVVAHIVRMQKSPNRRHREDSAHDLRKVDWRCHPEVLGALAFTLLRDCDEDVREEAAQSLTKMGACTPVVHESLARAASVDPDRATRNQARRGLRALARRCTGSCRVCDAGLSPSFLEAPHMIEPPASFLEPMPSSPSRSDEPEFEPISPPAPPRTAPVDSRVSPPATELAPLPAEADELERTGGLKPLSETSVKRESRLSATPARPRIATIMPRILRPRSSR